MEGGRSGGQDNAGEPFRQEPFFSRVGRQLKSASQAGHCVPLPTQMPQHLGPCGVEQVISVQFRGQGL